MPKGIDMEISANGKIISFADNERLWNDYHSLPFEQFAKIYLEPAMVQLDQARTTEAHT